MVDQTRVLTVLAGLTVQTHQTAPSVNLVCQQGFAPSQLEVSYPTTPCEPCLEHNQAYFGNNIRAVPNYGVADYQACRSLCRKESKCFYFTYDKKNEWCYLKFTKKVTDRDATPRFISGSQSLLCQKDEDNEINDEKETHRTEVGQAITEVSSDTSTDQLLEESRNNEEATKSDERKSDKKEVSGTPIISIYHDNGSRTVLTAIPASFGMVIKNTTKLTGRLYLLDTLMCSTPTTLLLYSLGVARRRGFVEDDPQVLRFAVITRGGCRFAKKAENAARAGFDGVIILDDQEDTETKHISGDHTEVLNQVPVLFLLKKEAQILEEHLRENPSLMGTIQDASTFSWNSRRPTTGMPSEATSDVRDGFLLGMKDPFFWPFRRESKRPRQDFGQKIIPTTMTVIVDKLRNSGHSGPEAQELPGGIVHITPLTLGSLIVGGLLGLLLLVSITTLLVSRYTRRARRRANHTRCQLAIRNMEAQKSASHDNNGFSPDGGSSSTADKPFPKSAQLLLECPVCLELAWPPKRIFQCREGHIICETCKSNPHLKVCPMCRIPFASNFTSRNRQLEELARTLKEEEKWNSSEPSAPPLPDITVTCSPPIPISVFSSAENLTVTTVEVSVEPEPLSSSDPLRSVDSSAASAPSEFADIVLEPRPSSAVRRTSTSSGRSGPLTVILPPE